MFKYEDFINGTNDIKRAELLRYMEGIGITTDSSNGSSHLRLTNAAGSRQNLVMHPKPVDQGTRHSIRKFIDEHLAALAPKPIDVPPPPVIHIDDEDAIRAAGLQLHELSQEEHYVILTDARYPEIAVKVFLHEDLAVTDSHIKAAAAERDAVVATYEAELQRLQKAHNICRVMVDDEPRLQIISKSSGRKKTGTDDVAVPSLEECDSIEALDTARQHALNEIFDHAEALQAHHMQPARLPARTVAARQAEFETMRVALEAVGLTLEEKRVDATRVAYDCRYAAYTFPSIIEGLDAQKMQGKTPGELRQAYPGVDEETLHGLLEVHSGQGVQLHYVVDHHNDGAPSEEALAQLRDGIAQQATHRKALLTNLLKSRDTLVVEAKEDGVHYRFPSKRVKANEPRFGVANHAQFEHIELPLTPSDTDSVLAPEVMRDLKTIHHMRVFDGYRRYEIQLLEALATMGGFAVFVDDDKGTRISIRNRQHVELSQVPVKIGNANDMNPYLFRFGKEVEHRYEATLAKAMVSFGWQLVRETKDNTYYKHATLPDEVTLPRYKAVLLNHEAVMNALGAIDERMHRAEVNHVDNQRANTYEDCVALLKQLGYREVANGTTKLYPPREVQGLSAVVLRDPENYTVKQSDLRLLMGEIEKAEAAQQKQQELIGRLQQAFGDDFAQDETGITLQLPTRKGDRLLPQSFAFAVTRTGEPSGYLSITGVKQLTLQLSGRTSAGFAEKYAQRGDHPGLQR